MRVLFCTDGSNISYNAIKNFSRWAKDVVVDVLCVIDWSFLPDSAAVEDSNFVMQCTNTADNILDESEKIFAQNGIITGEKLKICGTVIDGITETCEKTEYDFIVLGSHGKKGVQKWLGSVSQELASSLIRPVYISKISNEGKNILFALDNSQISEDTFKKVLNLFDLTDKNIHLLTAYEMPDFLFLRGNFDSSWMFDIRKKQETAALLLLNKFDNLLKERYCTPMNKVIVQGTPASEILRYAKENKIDLIVCGNKNYKKLSKFLLGSVSLRVLENTESDVLIIK